MAETSSMYAYKLRHFAVESTMTLKSQISISKLVYWLSITDRYLTKLLHTKNYQRLNWPKQTKCPTLLPMPNPYKILFEFKTK